MKRATMILLLLLCTCSAGAAFSIPRHTIDCGGGLSSSASFRLHGTVGQAEANAQLASNASWRLRGGFWVGVTQTPTSTDPALQLPEAFRLHGNFPNPFNPSTTIHFELPVAQRVRVEIHNLRGERVQLLADQELAAGRHELIWNGRDDGDAGVASGVYFVSVRAGAREARHKISLVK